MTETIETDTPKTPPRDPFKGLRRAAIALVILAIIWLLFGQAVPRLLFKPAAPPVKTGSAVHETVPALQERIDRLEAKIAGLEDALAHAGEEDGGSLTDARITALQSKLEALQQAPSSPETAGNARVAQLENAVQSLQHQLSDMQEKSQQQLSALSVFAEMKDTIQRGEAFGEPLQQLRQLAGENGRAQEILKQMAPFTRSGTTLTQLQDMFESTVPQALASDEGESLFKRNLRSLISIRKVGEKQDGDDDESIIARAEVRLQRGEVDASIKELAALSPSAGPRFSTWINKARIWLYLRNKLDALQLALIEPKGETAAPPAASTPPAPTAPATPPEASPSAGTPAPAASTYFSTPLPPLPPLPELVPPASTQSLAPARSE
jgi:hypothetical protein